MRPAELGSPLVKGRDEGGDRWFLDGVPIATGSGLELALELDGKRCDKCKGEGILDREDPEEGDPLTCPECGGAGSVYRVDWLRVRFETEHVRGPDGTTIQVPVLYLPAARCCTFKARTVDALRFRPVRVRR